MNPMLNFPDQPPNEPIRPPIVYVKEKAAWEYRQLVRNLAKEKAPTEEELNSFGAEGWELAGVFTDSPLVYFYFKRWVE
jgi:hypothetical protein